MFHRSPLRPDPGQGKFRYVDNCAVCRYSQLRLLPLHSKWSAICGSKYIHLLFNSLHNDNRTAFHDVNHRLLIGSIDLLCSSG